MPKTAVKDKTIETAKRKLGKEIVECRKELSQRKLAAAVGLPPSNMKYIEDGVNAPSSEVYKKIIEVLHPDKSRRKKMDKLYMTIRKTPPPDVCEIMIENEEINDAVRLIEGQVLTDAQIHTVKSLFTTFIPNKEKGAAQNG